MHKLLLSLVVVVAAVAMVPMSISDKFGDACGRPCSNNNGCDPGGPCSWCDPSDGFCKKGHECGMTCGTDSDCDQTGNCTICPKGHCQSGGFCNQYCLSGEDCIGTCNLCQDHVCKAGCQGTCDLDLDCQYDGSQCEKCINRQCQKGGCFAECSTDSDCSREAPCNHCFGGKCTSTCDQQCSSDAECNGEYTGCGYCNEGTCKTGTCGSVCAVGNNGGCMGNATCTYCNATSATCTIGKPCFDKCMVNSDCDQTGSCKLCSAHGFCVGMADFERHAKETAEAAVQVKVEAKLKKMMLG